MNQHCENNSPGQLPRLQSTTSVSCPTQFWPPFWGAGSLHSLVFDIVPCPHDFEQDPSFHGPQFPSSRDREQSGANHFQKQGSFQVGLIGLIGLPIQFASWQTAVSATCPMQSWPPFSGKGLLHSLVRDVTPGPHDDEQGLSIQEFQLPSTKENLLKNNSLWSSYFSLNGTAIFFLGRGLQVPLWSALIFTLPRFLVQILIVPSTGCVSEKGTRRTVLEIWHKLSLCNMLKENAWHSGMSEHAIPQLHSDLWQTHVYMG